MGTMQAASIEASTYLACNSPSKKTGRSLCASCLNRNLQRACQKTIVLLPGSTRIGLGAPRAFFPGMPRAVLGPAVHGAGESIPALPCRVRAAGNNPAPSSVVRSSNCKPEPDASSRSSSSKDGQNDKAERADENGAECRNAPLGNQGKSNRSEEPKRFATEGEEFANVATEQWQLFQIRKNLTVRIPSPPTVFSMPSGGARPLAGFSKKHGYNCLPARKEICPRNTVRPSKVKKWTIRPDANAEAELMMRLLADSIPILKSTAPLVLPACKVRPAPISPLSPPGDPLWKRRCIPCPKSLKVQATSICV